MHLISNIFFLFVTFSITIFPQKIEKIEISNNKVFSDGEIKKWAGELIETLLLLVALGVSVEILLGNKGPLFGGVATALIGLVATLGANGLVGLIALGVIAFVIGKRRVAQKSH